MSWASAVPAMRTPVRATRQRISMNTLLLGPGADDPSPSGDACDCEPRGRSRPGWFGSLHSGDHDEDAEPVTGLAKIAGKIGEGADGGLGGGALRASRCRGEEALIGCVHRGKGGLRALEASRDLCG